MVTMSGSQASGRRFESPLDPYKLIKLVAIKCAALWRAVYNYSAIETICIE